MGLRLRGWPPPLGREGVTQVNTVWFRGNDFSRANFSIKKSRTRKNVVPVTKGFRNLP